MNKATQSLGRLGGKAGTGAAKAHSRLLNRRPYVRLCAPCVAKKRIAIEKSEARFAEARGPAANRNRTSIAGNAVDVAMRSKKPSTSQCQRGRSARGAARNLCRRTHRILGRDSTVNTKLGGGGTTR